MSNSSLALLWITGSLVAAYASHQLGRRWFVWLGISLLVTPLISAQILLVVGPAVKPTTPEAEEEYVKSMQGVLFQGLVVFLLVGFAAWIT